MEDSKVFCPNCGTSSPSGTHFCYRCGAKLPDLSEFHDEPANLPGLFPDDKRKSGRQPESSVMSVEPLPAEGRETDGDRVLPTTERVPVAFGGPPSVFLKQQVTTESDADPRFLKGYSFGPGCGFYLLNRVFWPLFLIGAALHLLSRGIESAAQTPSDAAALAPLSVTIGVINLAFLGVLIWLGTVARKKRWEKLNWKSFSQFRSDEGAWNIAGIIGWILTVIVLIASFAIGCAEALQPYP